MRGWLRDTPPGRGADEIVEEIVDVQHFARPGGLGKTPQQAQPSPHFLKQKNRVGAKSF